MAQFESIQDPSHSSELIELYNDILQNGFGADSPINWFASQAIRPDILESTWLLTKRILIGGELPPTLKQMIALTISKNNNCRYCTKTHTGALEALGVSKEIIESCVLDPDLRQLPLQHREVLKFAIKAAKDPNGLDKEDYQELKNNGMSQKEIMEVIMMAAFTNFINTWADASGIETD